MHRLKQLVHRVASTVAAVPGATQCMPQLDALLLFSTVTLQRMVDAIGATPKQLCKAQQ
jgi:hypothetical protein